ncbi:alpha/beta hydrolase [Alteriqipengyuania lutimaris]|uniref:Alpha/beta hydrolase n=1 Tax=Alteriqipengyuania lutimaris TaxID=1538146 RepID=A0A395LN11_9SPHN|nr:alpha/beta hydrolase [Alteriqipengyuania lutimaris]MBB3032421.1 acetyl esterase [Alteriqipengyuania lutimaris]RDS78433.1 alpha/beta hydrolase [Alteriqipengyuania lutimaris]
MGRFEASDARVDPDIARFVAELEQAYAEHATQQPADPTERRRIAELVRKEWRSGGPPMAETKTWEHEGLRLRLHRPIDEAGLPVLFYIHGGGWTIFSIDTHDRLMREYAARAGIAVIGIDYSLAPESRYPIALNEVVDTLDWLEREGGELGIDTQRMAIGGDSAGANLCVAACLRRRDAGGSLLAGMLLNYGAFDPQPRQSYKAFSGPQYTLEADEMDAFWRGYVRSEEDLDDPLVAPIRANLERLPPAFVGIAECDILTDSNIAFADRLEAAGVPVQRTIYRGATHSFLEAMAIAPIARRALAEQSAWLRERLDMD